MTAWLIGVAVVALVIHGPIAQTGNYHSFADQSVLWGVPHAGDVLSNLAFALVACWGLLRLRTRSTMFLVALGFTALGSTFYHLAPSDDRLVWDRLFVALTSAGLLVAVREDVERRRLTVLPVVLTLLAAGSVWWWWFTGEPGPGDLRPYLLLQAAPLVLVPVWQMQAGRPLAERRAFAIAIGIYVLARAAEVADHAVYAWIQPISGHTLKHVLAAGAAAVIVRARIQHPGLVQMR